MGIATKPMTWEEFSAIQDEPNQHELVRGELFTMPPPKPEHGYIANNINIPLGSHVKKNKLGYTFAAETGFLLETDPDTVRAPDVCFIERSRFPEGRPGGDYVRGAPEFLVEVLAPSDTTYGAEEKIEAWIKGGAKLVWLVNPKRKTVTVYRPGKPPALFVEGQALDASDVVAGFTLPVDEIFA